MLFIYEFALGIHPLLIKDCLCIMTVGSVFANITAVAGINAAVVNTSAVAVPAAAAVGGSEIWYELSMIRNFVHGYNLCVLYSC